MASMTTQLVDKRGNHLKIVRSDAWKNTVTGHGTSRDKRTYGEPSLVLSSLDRQRLEDIYHGDDIGATIVDRPIEDMLRKGIRLNVTMGDDAEANTQAADDMLQALEDLGAWPALEEGLTWASVFGGSVVFIQADDGGGDDIDSMAQPLNENRIRSIQGFEVFDRWDVEINTEYGDPTKPNYGQPETYRLNTQTSARGQPTVPQRIVHESRVLRFDGVKVNHRRLQRNSGWHDSVYIRLDPILRDFGISWGSVANLMTDFATAVFKSPALNDLLATDGGDEIMERLTNLDLCRSTLRMVPIDTTEELLRTVTPVAGLAELLTQFILRISAAARMPVTVLWGQAPSGLNSTAEGDLSVWYDRVGSMQKAKLRRPLQRLIDLLWLSADGPTRGREPESWALEFEQLWQMSEKETAEAHKTQSETDANYIDTGVLTPDEVASSRFGGDRYSYETQLDQETREAEAQAPTPAVEPEAPLPVQRELPRI